MLNIGLDPGVSGGIAVLCNGTVDTIKLSETEADIAEFLRQWTNGDDCVKAYLERVSAMPKQGVSSTFKFGTSYGFLRGLLIGLRIPFESVTPGEWQRRMRCLSRGDKKVTRSRAQELFPQVKVINAIADAILIAEFGRRKENGIT